MAVPRRRWTDEQLRQAVRKGASYTAVVEHLREVAGGSSYVAVRVRIAELGLDVEHLERDRKARKAARERTRIKGRGNAANRRPGHRRTWSDAQLREAVPVSQSYAEVLRRLGLRPGGGAYVALKRHIERLGLDTSHMGHQGWARGKKLGPSSRARPLDEILVRDSDYLTTSLLKRRLVEAGLLEWRCAVCQLNEWNGEKAPLQLDHMNGDRRDNRLENLRLVCPNCHAQTDTWCGKNVGAYDDVG